jgi:phosphomannomutase/phosphoglucomutase
MLSQHIFRAYDIRGIAGTDFDESGAEKIGRAYITYLIRNDGIPKPNICVGRDGRISGESMQQAFIRGAVSAGAKVTDIGLSPSPLLFFSICEGGFHGGVNITASHNPKQYNGFKLQRNDAHAICGDEIQEIWNICQNEDFETGNGSTTQKDFIREYFQKIESIVDIPTRPKIVIDAGNGVAGAFAPELYTRLGCEVIPLYCEVDGNFPNHDADPEVEENLTDLKKTVLKTGADLGVAFDGDGDRVGFVDAEGKAYPSDLILLLLSRDLLTRHPNAKVVIDLKATQILFEDISKRGGEGVMVKTGHSFVEEKMREVGALLGGEVSGHLFFGENYYGFDDALLAGAKVIEILQKSQKPLKEHFAELPQVYNTPEIKVVCPEQHKFIVIERLVEHFVAKYGEENCLTIDGVRIDFGDGAWGIVRASNTSPKITLRFEARTAEKMEEIKNIVLEKLYEQSEIPNES